MTTTLLIVILLSLAAFAALAGWLGRRNITRPMVFTAVGYGLSHLPDMHGEAVRGGMHVLAEITLIIVLFADASRVRFKALAQSYAIPLRMLLIGMPLTIGLGTLVVGWINPATPWLLCALTAAILTPTDAALGQAVVESPAVPGRVRDAINVESGLNDGLALPVVMVLVSLFAQSLGEAGRDDLLSFTTLQLTLGPAIGIGIGLVGAWLLNQASTRGWSTETSQGVFALCMPFLAWIVAENVGGNGFIAAFLGGLAYGNMRSADNAFVHEFMEGEGQILTALTFLAFGAILLPIGLEHANGRTLMLAIAFLTVVRMLPVYLSLVGTDLTTYERLFLGWFGPRGLASIIFALLVLEHLHFAGSDEMLACVTLTVALSVILHGLSAGPMAGRFSVTQSQREET